MTGCNEIVSAINSLLSSAGQDKLFYSAGDRERELDPMWVHYNQQNAAFISITHGPSGYDHVEVTVIEPPSQRDMALQEEEHGRFPTTRHNIGFVPSQWPKYREEVMGLVKEWFK